MEIIFTFTTMIFFGLDWTYSPHLLITSPKQSELFIDFKLSCELDKITCIHSFVQHLTFYRNEKFM